MSEPRVTAGPSFRWDPVRGWTARPEGLYRIIWADGYQSPGRWPWHELLETLAAYRDRPFFRGARVERVDG